MLVQVLQEVYARQDETCKRLLEEVPVKDEGRRQGGRESLHVQRPGRQRLQTSVKLSDHSAIPRRLGKASGALTKRAAHEKALRRGGTSPQALLSPRWEQPQRRRAGSRKGRKRGSRPTTLPAAERQQAPRPTQPGRE